MMEPEPDFHLTIQDAVDTFRQALISLLPAAERAVINWHDDAMSDDWETLAETAFEVFVARPVVNDVAVRGRGGLFPLQRFNFDFQSYSGRSWIEVELPGHDSVFAFVRFYSEDTPFDTVHLVQVDLDTQVAGDVILVPYRGLTFRARRRFSDGWSEVVSEVVLDE